MATAGRGTVVFVHGMFMTSACWQGWQERFTAAGHTCLAPAWPGRDRPVAELRQRHPDPELGRLDLPTIVAHYEAVIRGLPEQPILVGHSQGGLIVQLLLQRGLGRAGVAIDSAPPRGVFVLSLPFLTSNWPLINPLIPGTRPYFMPFEHFQSTFVHTLSLAEQRAVYDSQVVPDSRLVGRAAFTSAAAVDFGRPRPPLLLIAGTEDRIIPAALNRANLRRYLSSAGVTDYQEFPGRTHYIIGQPGWQDVADYALDWISHHG
jgi:pimeloyl-ACP methyl ester carboxylesterase